MRFWQKRSCWTDESLDNIAATVRDFARHSADVTETPRFQQKIDDYKKMLRGTPIVQAEIVEMAGALAKCFDRRSPMIRLLDDPAWRESLKVAETPRVECFTAWPCKVCGYMLHLGDVKCFDCGNRA